MNMKKVLPVIVLCVINMVTQAQPAGGPAGIYYLEGVMETASGIKLNADSTFEFFFSQGALDRTGRGKWKQQGDRVVLQSDGEKEKGFILKRSDHSVKNKTVVVIKEPNSMLVSFVYVRFGDKQDSDFAGLPKDGILESPLVGVDKIQLLFELCPETIHEFIPENAGDTYFEFTFHPSVFDVRFDNFELKLADWGFEGAHPLLQGTSFRYVKN